LDTERIEAEGSTDLKLTETILLVDDNTRLLAGLKMRLELLGYRVLLANDGLQALETLQQHKPNLIVADIMMPKMDGWELFEKVRSNQQLAAIPFIFLTARSDELSTHQGKALGAEDYISKPFDTRDLIASIQGRLRRSAELAELGDQLGGPGIPDHIEIHNLKIMPRAQQVFISEEEISLTPIEYSLLLYMAVNADQVCPFEQMARAVYTDDYQPWRAQETLRVHINNLRRKLHSGSTELNLIKNVRGIGYRLDTAAVPV